MKSGANALAKDLGINFVHILLDKQGSLSASDLNVLISASIKKKKHFS